MNIISRLGLGLNKKVVVPDRSILLPGEFNATVEVLVREGIFDPNGKVLKHIPEKRAESFVVQFLELLTVQFGGIGEVYPLPITDIENNTRYIQNSYYTLNCKGDIGDDSKGIVVGTGATSPTISDYKLQTQIVHGSGSGEMLYGGVTFGAPTSDSTTSHFTITRDFANSSGAAIVVKEIGLYNNAFTLGVSRTLGFWFMTLHDLIDSGSGISVANGNTLTINYRPSATI